MVAVNNELSIAENTAPPFSGQRILIIDDDDLLRGLLSKIVLKHVGGCKIDLAANGLEALKLCKDIQYDVVISDVDMPVMDGITANIEIRKEHLNNGRKMPAVIFYTGNSVTDSLSDILRENPDYSILSKPVSREVLCSAIKAKLEAAKRSRRFSVPNAIIAASSRCRRNYSCLETGLCGTGESCGVDLPYRGDMILLLSNKHDDSCPYIGTQENSHICTCPALNYLYSNGLIRDIVN